MEFIPVGNPTIGEEEAKAVYDVIKTGWISMGKKTQEMEKMICDYVGVKHAILLSNGTATLHAALMALGVGPGDEVVVPTLSYISSANAVLFCGAKPVFCEVDPATYNLRTEDVEKVLTPRTKAIMTVDLKGMPIDYDKFVAFAKSKNIPILADSAESFGAKYKGKMVGNQTEVHSFSFFANKNITMGEGGVITTDNDAIAAACRVMRNQGQSERYVHSMIGHNYRPTDYAAAFGIEQLKRVEWVMDEKNKVAKFYNEALSKHPLIQIPNVPDYVTRHSWYLYCVHLAPTVNRDEVVKLMRAEGVDTRLSFPPIHLQPVYKKQFGYKEGDYPVSEKIYAQFLDIPSWAQMGIERMTKVVNVLKASAEKANRA